MRKLLLLLLLPLFAHADDTAALNALLAAGNTTLPASHTYTISASLNVLHNFNLNGSTITSTATSGSILQMPTAGVTVQNGIIQGSSGTYTGTGVSGINLNAANLTVTNMTVRNVPEYGIVGGSFSNQTVTNSTITNTGYIGVALTNSSGTVSGITVTNNTIDRTAQGIGVQQAALIVRAQLSGVMTGSIVTGNTLRMPTNPTSTAGECFEIRGNYQAKVSGNVFTGGTIGLSIVGGSFVHSASGTYSGQNTAGIELASVSNSYAAGTFGSGVDAYLVDGSVTFGIDTIGTSTFSGLSSYPILVNTSSLTSLLVQNVTGTTTKSFAYIKYATGITFNNCTVSGNNTAAAFVLDTAPGGIGGNGDTFSGFTPKIIGTFNGGATPILVNNVIFNGVAPTGSFLGVSLSANVTLGSNICFNCAPLVPNPLYSPNTYSYYINTAITPVTPSNSGGTATGWSVSPTQPSGISFSTATGIFSGTPLALSMPTTYTVTATNSSGSSTTPITITVINNPPIISYSPNTQACTIGVAITPMTPINTGGSAINYTVSPALPLGLSINSSGVISGTPTALSVSTTYTVTAYNTGGNSPTTITLAVSNPAPAAPSISYSPSTNIYPINVAITPLVPTNMGGSATSWGISPSLPAGLSLSTSTGVISGTPTALSSATTYTISATNITGTGTAHVTLSVINVLPVAPVISYTPNNITLQQNITALVLLPANSGGTVVSYSITPTLPTGISLNTSTGLISGTATVLSPSTTYTVTASNTGGSGTAPVTIMVVGASPGTSIRVSGIFAIFE